MYLQVPPLAYMDASNQPAGYDVDLLRMLAEALNVKLDIKNLDFAGLIPGVQSGKFDMASTGIFPTAERAKVVDFSRVYMPTVVVLAVPNNSSLEPAIQAYNQPNITIAVESGSSDLQIAQKNFPKAKIVTVGQQATVLVDVEAGRADAAVLSEFILVDYLKANPGKLKKAALPAPLDVTWGAWAVQKGNSSLLASLDSFLCKNQADGTLAKLYKQNFGVSDFPTPPAPPC